MHSQHGPTGCNEWEFFYDESGRLTLCKRPDGTSIDYRWNGESVEPPPKLDANGHLDPGGGTDV